MRLCDGVGWAKSGARTCYRMQTGALHVPTSHPHRIGLKLQSVTEGSCPLCESEDIDELVNPSIKPIMASMIKKKSA